MANHNSRINNKILKDSLYLFWPVIDETDYFNPYVDAAKLKCRQKIIDLKPSHHIFILWWTLSLFGNSQKNGIYEGNNKVITLSLVKDEFYAIKTLPLQKFK